MHSQLSIKNARKTAYCNVNEGDEITHHQMRLYTVTSENLDLAKWHRKSSATERTRKDSLQTLKTTPA